jgi:sulfur-carrier protein adenylyltransferase/sulfurtransferase
MKPLTILAIPFLILGFVIAMVPKNTTKPYKLTSEQVLKEIQEGSQLVTPDVVADMLVKKDPTLQLIDVRTPAEFEKYSLEGAINIPLSEILSDKWTDVLDQGTKMNVFYSNSTLEANEAWMLTRQFGYQNNYVLQGGLNYWTETITNPFPPANTSPDEEIAKYNFRKAAGKVLGGGDSLGTAPSSDAKSAGSKPAVAPKKKKKGASGGC